MPHLVVDHARLAELRELAAEWDDNAFEDGEWENDAADWSEKVIPLLRALVDPRGELPDLHGHVAPWEPAS